MMFRYGAAVAVLVGLCSYQGSALAQAPSKSWSAAVFVRPAAGNAAPFAIRTAARKTRRRVSRSKDAIPPLPVRKSAKGQPAKAEPPAPQVWQPHEIAAAKARCAKLLKGIDAVAIPQSPIREGMCGAAAPIRLVSLGKSPQVAFSPPALVDCDMAAALHTWLKKDLQPLAAKHLGARIIKVEVMSDYSCRNVAGSRRLSEHARANALDIRGFVTETGQTARVLDGWGKTERDIAEEEAAAAKAKALAQADVHGGKTTTGTTPGTRKEKGTLKLAADRLGGPGKAHEKRNTAKYAALSPQVPAQLKSSSPPVKGPRSRFLRAAHAAACRIFGTTLGPEANKAHRNHFHVDMAVRKWKKICD